MDSSSPQSLSADADAIDRVLSEIHALVALEDFAGIEKLVAALPNLVEAVPVASREVALLKVQSCLQGVEAGAVSKSEQISSRLDALRNGRVATSAYQATARIPGAG